MTLDHVLTEYEAEVELALADRRDTATRLMDLLAEDVAEYGPRVEAVRAGRVTSLLEPLVAGHIRQLLSDAVIDFEAARHRFRLALVAVALEHGMTARQVGDSFAFSRQLASRYVKEARAKWPALCTVADNPCTGEGDAEHPPADRTWWIPAPSAVDRSAVDRPGTHP